MKKLTEVDHAQTDNAIERGPDTFLVQNGLLFVNPGLSGFQSGFCFIKNRLGNGFSLDQIGIALELLKRQPLLGFQGFQRGLVRIGV